LKNQVLEEVQQPTLSIYHNHCKMGLQPNPTKHHQNGVVNSRQEHEEALLALIKHRTHEVKQLHYYISYYTS